MNPVPPRRPEPGSRPVGHDHRIAGLSLASRVLFASILLPWFLIGGLSKLGGLSLSLGPTVEGLPLALGAYYAYAPGQIDQLISGAAGFGSMTQAYVGLMVLLELALPVLIVLGLLARLAVLLLAGHQTLYFLSAQPAAEYGAFFDASPFDMMPDQLLLWLMLIAPVALFGPGPLSIDRLIATMKDRRG